MMLIDANLLVYAFSTSSPEHERALAWLDRQFTGTDRVALPWESLNDFVRLVSNPRIQASPVSVKVAWQQVDRWLGHPVTWLPVPTPNHASVMRELLGEGSWAANDVPDVHLAALAISHGLRLASHDAGFGRFTSLRWFDPLV
jgi:toxin-antitoxin system PIN domain toxin